jgi:hypothetical protein
MGSAMMFFWSRRQSEAGTPRLALAMSHRGVDFLNPHLERSEQMVSRIGGWVLG